MPRMDNLITSRKFLDLNRVNSKAALKVLDIGDVIIIDCLFCLFCRQISYIFQWVLNLITVLCGRIA